MQKVALLAPFSTPGTARYHVIEDRHRDDFLSDRRETPESGASAWWELSDALSRKRRLPVRRSPLRQEPITRRYRAEEASFTSL
jgi:hypothetical protein